MRADVLLLSISTYTLCIRNEQRPIPSANNKLHFIYFFLLRKKEKSFSFSGEKLTSILQTVFHQITKTLGLGGVSLQFLLSFCFLEWDCCLKALEDFEIPHPTMQGYLCSQHRSRVAIHHSQTVGCVRRFLIFLHSKLQINIFAFQCVCWTLVWTRTNRSQEADSLCRGGCETAGEPQPDSQLTCNQRSAYTWTNNLMHFSSDLHCFTQEARQWRTRHAAF